MDFRGVKLVSHEITLVAFSPQQFGRLVAFTQQEPLENQETPQIINGMTFAKKML